MMGFFLTYQLLLVPLNRIKVCSFLSGNILPTITFAGGGEALTGTEDTKEREETDLVRPFRNFS